MATVAVGSANPVNPSNAAGTWMRRIWLDLQPTPGRLSATLRIVLASILTLIFLLVWQVPFVSIALYFVFIINRENPSVSLRTGVFSIFTLVAAVATDLGLVALSDNDPMARLIGVAVVSFVAGMLVVSTTVPTLGSTWGFIFCTLIAFWERHAPEDALVKGSLWIVAAVGIAVGCSIAVEYVFATRNPAELLAEERRNRYRSLAVMFSLYAEGADSDRLREAAVRVSRLAAAGQTVMMRLYNSIVDRNLDSGMLPIGTRVRITMLAQLMDVSAAFGLQTDSAEDPELQGRCLQIASECKALLEDAQPQHPDFVQPGLENRLTLLDRVEANLHLIASMPYDLSPDRDKVLVALPANKVPLLIPGAFREVSTWAFGFKISLCATLCYVLYFSVDWPGISTSVTTVLIAGLSTTGALKQKFAFRLAGALIGGLFLGLGCTVFVFPHMDSITSLTVLVAILAFGAAWIAAGRQFSYVGLQIMFAFYLVAFEDFRAPTQLAPARDRLIGILLALVVMWFVFDQMWPVRTVTAMRQALASLLNSEVALFKLEMSSPPRQELVRQADTLRDHISKTMAAIRTMNDEVEYEFGVDRERHIETANAIVRGGLTAVTLIWNEIVMVHKDEDGEFPNNPQFVELRQRTIRNLSALANSVLQKARLKDSGMLVGQTSTLASAELLEDTRYGEYAVHVTDRYRELESIVAGLEGQV